MTPTFFYISGITRDYLANALGGVTTRLFVSSNDLLISVGLSDANGDYNFYANPSIQYYVTTFKAGSPNLTGHSDRNLSPVASPPVGGNTF